MTRTRASMATATALCLAATAMAQTPPPVPFNPQQQMENWGRVLYCKQVYAHPDNSMRVYEYDHEQCAAAEDAVQRRLGPLTPEVRAELRKVAQRNATRILASTPDITKVLPACRETCQSLAGGPAPDAGGNDAAADDGEQP